MNQNEERDWVASLRSSGEEQERAIEELRTYLLRGLKSAFVGKRVDASFCEDMAQEAIIKILGKLDQFEGRSRFKTWSMTIAIRTAVSEFRRKHFQDISLDPGGDEALRIDAPDDSPTASAVVQRSSLLNALRKLIENELSDKQRVAVQAILGGMPVEEIAKRVHSNRNAVYKLIHDARKRLKKGLEVAGYDWASIQSLLA